MHARKVIDWSRDLQVVYKACKNFRFAFQAGGNMGVWPWLMSKRFKKVITCEPDPVCWPHLRANLADVNNVESYKFALLDKEISCSMNTEKPDNLGAQFVVPGQGDVFATTIDALCATKEAVDLIYLDIEGAELHALYGAVDTLAKHRPVVVVEDNGLAARFGNNKGDVERWLYRDFGYVVAARPHRDVVMVCK